MSLQAAARFALFTASLLPAVGCIIVAPPDPGPPGDISFLWSFAGETDCTAARVDEIDVLITDSDGNTARNLDRITCEGGGLTIDTFDPGTYDILVEAYNDRGTLLYEGSATATVVSDTVTDIGVIELSRAGDATKGAIAFYWDFDGEATCAGAGVAEVDIELVDASTSTSVIERTEDCFGGGLVISDIDPGTYTFYIDAFDDSDAYLYAASVQVTVVAGQTLDLGVLDLDPVGMSSDMGVLSLDFGFLYPATMAETDCAVAGVYEVDVVIIDGPGGATVSRETIACNGNGVGVDLTLTPGEVQFYLEAYGEYDGSDVLLYDTADQSATVTADASNVLGLVELERVSDNFTDIRFTHTLPQGEDCASLGITDMSFTITRLVDNTELVDDMGTFSCTDTFVLRETFVPGSYRIYLSATGYIGTATASAAPSEVAMVNVDVVAN
jgi:hypothetical protein